MLDELERAAQKVVRGIKQPWYGTSHVRRMKEAWAQFPECRDDPCPSAQECLTIVARIRAESEADKQFNETLKASNP